MSAVRRGFAAALLALLVSAAPAAAKGDVVISQFRSQGPGGDFVELKNISGQVVNLAPGGWSVSALDADANSGCGVTYSGPALTLAPGQHYLFTQGGWSGTGATAADSFFETCGLYDGAGQLTLSMWSDAVTGRALVGDVVTWGALAPWGPSDTEPDKLPSVPSNGAAMKRKNGGTKDDDSNINDFEVNESPDPVNSAATAPAPGVTTGDATAVLDTSATLHGTANPYASPVSDCHFEYGTDTSYGATAPCPTAPSGTADVAITRGLTGLSPSTQYHYRLVVTSGRGTSNGADRTFTTTVADPGPVATAEPATEIGSASATLKGSVNPRGATVSDCHFEYGVDTAFDKTAQCASTPAGADPVAVSAIVTDLAPSTSYRFRLVVTTGNPPTATSAEQSVDTLAVVPSSDKLVISQFRADGPSGPGGDFVELTNISNETVSLIEGWTLQFSGFGQCSVISSGPAVNIAPGQRFLIPPPNNWSGPAGDAAYTTQQPRCAGDIPSSRGNLTLSAFNWMTGVFYTDSVSWGTLSNPSSGPTYPSVPNDGRVLRRKSNGTQDTDHSRDDLEQVAPDPKNMSQTAPSPTGTTDDATTVSATGATLNGTVNPRGGTVTDCHFDYGTSTGYGSTVPCASTPSGTDPVTVSADVSGLPHTTRHHYRLRVTTTGGALTGDDVSFDTDNPTPPPTGTTDDATRVGAATATLNATVNPRGASVSDCHFDFGPTESYGTSVPCTTTPAGNNAVAVTGLASELDPSTGYHFRIRLTTGFGDLTGADKTFTSDAVVDDDNAIVISQFRSRGPGKDFVELLNVSDSTVTLAAGWTMTNFAPDGNSGCSLVPNGPAVDLAPGQHYLVAETGWEGTTAADLIFVPNGEFICGHLIDNDATLSFSGGDEVAYGAIQPGGFNNEPDPISTVPDDGKALQRRDSGQRDTGNNFDDFRVVTANPGNFQTGAPPAGVTTTAATQVGSARATFNGTVRPVGQTITNCRFEYGTDADFASATPYPNSVPCPSTPSGTGTVAVSVTRNGLTGSTGYHYRLVAESSTSGVLQGADQQFTTADPPTVTTGDPADFGSRSVTLSGTVDLRGETASGCFFEFGTDADFATATPYPQWMSCNTALSANGPTFISRKLTGLAPGTGYHVRMRLTTDVAGTQYSADKTFTTTAAPVASTNPASEVGNRRATLNGSFNPRGEAVTNCRFEYGTTESYGSTTPCSPTPDGLNTVQVSGLATGLPVTTAHHFRLVVTTDGGTYTGDDAEFATTTPPFALTDAASAIGSRTTTLNGTVNPRGETVTNCRFEWGTDADFATATKYPNSKDCVSKPSGTSNAPVTAALTGLSPASGYHVRLVVTTSSSGTVEGADIAWSTTAVPSGTTGEATGVRSNRATLRGVVNPRGEAVTDCHFEYGSETVPCDPVPAGVDPVDVSAAVTGLSPDTDYDVELVFTTTPSGQVSAGEEEFSTTPAPTVVTDAASGVTTTAAVLNATANPQQETVSDCHFEYGATDSYGTSVPCASAPSGAAPVSVSRALSVLEPASTYHFRVVMTTPAGTVNGDDRTFKTEALPVVQPPAGSGGDGGGGGGAGGDGTGGGGTSGGNGGQAPGGPAPSGPVTPDTPAAPADTALTARLLVIAAKLRGTKLVARDGTVTLADVTCPSVCGNVSITAVAKLSSLRAAGVKRPVWGRGKATVTRGGKVRLTFRLNAAGRKALKSAESLKVAATVQVKSPAGQTVSVARTLTLRAR